VLAHLRQVKDPLAAATAARRLPPASRLAIVHAGRALEPELARAAEREMRANPRYRWLGDVPRARALSILAGSDLLIVSSRAEGGANVVSEAIACGRPVLSPRIEGSIGLLGEDHPGYFAPGDTSELGVLLERVEHDAAFREELSERSRSLLPRVDPAIELESWRTLLGELSRKEVA
jgi:glycosyltransferase involved in cell wall biosynthesis